MHRFRHSPLVRLLALPLALSMIVSGCYKWSAALGPLEHAPSREAVEQVLTDKNPSKIRVIRADGSTVELTRPRVENDSLIREPFPRQGVPVDEIRTLETREINGGTTALVVAGGLLVTVALIGVLTTDCDTASFSIFC